MYKEKMQKALQQFETMITPERFQELLDSGVCGSYGLLEHPVHTQEDLESFILTLRFREDECEQNKCKGRMFYCFHTFLIRQPICPNFNFCSCVSSNGVIIRYGINNDFSIYSE